MRTLVPLAVLSLSILAACSEPEPAGLPVLGAGTHDATRVLIDVIASADEGLSTPTDVSVNPNQPGQLWVTNYDLNAITILSGADFTDARTPTSGGANHFLVDPMSLAFSDDGTFATIHDTDELTQGGATPADFMGPVLWDDSDRFDGGHGGHLDMLHNSPLGGGIAWEADNVYWVVDGYYGSLTRYDFNNDHGYGGANHSDHETARYVEGEIARTEGIPSHADFDRSSDLLFVADSDNGRIAVLDATSGTPGDRIGPNYDGGQQYAMEGADLSTLVDGDLVEVVLTEKGEPTIRAVRLNQPAGLELGGGLLYVTDHATSNILAFDLEGQLVDWLPTGRPADSLGGIEVLADGSLVVTDLRADELIRIRPLPEEE